MSVVTDGNLKKKTFLNSRVINNNAIQSPFEGHNKVLLKEFCYQLQFHKKLEVLLQLNKIFINLIVVHYQNNVKRVTIIIIAHLKHL